MKPTNKPMKRLSIYLFLIFFSLPTPSQAEDIRDFQIEGMSIGDSLLDYFSEKEIKKAKRYDHTNTSWKSDKMFQLRTYKKGPYTEIMFSLKKNDKKYIIYGIAGLVKMEYNISECYPKLDMVADEFKQLFPNAKIRKKNDKHAEDKSGKSKVKSVYFYFSSGGYASVECYDWSKEMGYWDNFRVSVITGEFESWLNSNY